MNIKDKYNNYSLKQNEITFHCDEFFLFQLIRKPLSSIILFKKKMRFVLKNF